MAQYQVSSAWADVIRQGSPLSRVATAWADVIYSNVTTTRSQVSATWVDVIRSLDVKTNVQPVSKITAYAVGRTVQDDHLEAPKLTVYSVSYEQPVTATSTLTAFAVLGVPVALTSKLAAYAVLATPLVVSKVAGYAVFEVPLTTSKVTGYAIVRNNRKRRPIIIVQS